MIERACVLAAVVAALAASPSLSASASAQQPRAATARNVTIGYVELVDDPRYRAGSAYAGIVFRTLGRPFPGAQLGIEDAQTIGRIIQVDFALARARAATVDALADEVSAWSRDRGIHFVLADLPAADLLRLADSVAGAPVLLFNVSAAEDVLRGAQCRRNVAHVHPSTSMRTDALVQYLASRSWLEILVLQGPAPADALTVEAMRRSAAKFGAEIVDERGFVLGNDPRQRGQTNVAMMTGDADYDVVFVADASGEFGRYVPYQTRLPRPVVGSAGLVPRTWHWTWHRHGAPQLQHRFEAIALPRRMNDQAWAAWVAVKAVTQAVMRTEQAGFEEMRDFILGERINIDGSKGNPMNFRSWNQQLRQPLLLASADAVIARAPLPEFLHRENVLDTLGDDAAESPCRF